MSLRLTTDTLVAAYDFLCATEPFRGWRLPSSDDVEFHVMRTTNDFGDCDVGDEEGTYVIRISAGKNGHVSTLLATMSHEMIHVRQFMLGDSANHNDLFHKLARRVCRLHGYDPKAF